MSPICLFPTPLAFFPSKNITSEPWLFKGASPSPASTFLQSLLPQELDEIDAEGFIVQLGCKLSVMRRGAHPDWSRLLVKLTTAWHTFETEEDIFDELPKRSQLRVNYWATTSQP
jgi:hypothetical protein